MFDLSRFKKKKHNIGMDINAEKVKIVICSEDEGSYKLESFGMLEYNGNIENLKTFIEEGEIKKANLRINIEDPSLRIRRIELPQMTDEEIPEAIKWGIRDFIDGDVDDYIFDYIKIDPEDYESGDKIPLVVFAIKKDAVEKRLNFVTRIGLKRPSIIEPNAGALSSIFEYCRGVEGEGSYVLLDLGVDFSLFTVMGKKGLLFSRPLIGCADSDLISQIERDLGVDHKTAKKAKNNFFSDKCEMGEDEKGRLKNTISHFFSQLAIEIQRSIDGYVSMFAQEKVNQIYISGGGAYYLGITEYLTQTIGVEAIIFDPFECVNTKNFSPSELDDSKALFAVACGLAVD